MVSDNSEVARGAYSVFSSSTGGLHLALSRSSVNASIQSAFDWDQNACKVYEANHGRGVVERVSISTLTATNLARYEAEMWLLSPSCQPYTVLNPNAKGDLDPKAKSLGEQSSASSKYC
ncbi:hypothetical protein E1B28_010795 [Marasmius oreades]|uniref:Uncharacterized protein n=1 Tax=Marasmius oreades TaxID=181124 RepID=A0A9P7UQJ4_9AGAR|nr:uncharacterized protein E1B28_010795 [Marasmius oreades]KAG7089086.1 hypothetical protein E1B28_010795 [Marasmius oreades]